MLKGEVLSMSLSRLDRNTVHHPTVIYELDKRADDFQLRIADQITRFAGSMGFVYLPIVLFTVWMVAVESSSRPTLTLIVSLEAIFLSTFVVTGQNRQAAFQQEEADRDFVAQEMKLRTNTELTRATNDPTRKSIRCAPAG